MVELSLSPSNNPSSWNELTKLLQKQINDLKELHEETARLKKENEELRNSNNELKDNLDHAPCKTIQRKLESEIEEWKMKDKKWEQKE